MADLSLHSLFPILSFLAPHQSSRSARVVLTGPGGGVWRLGAQVDEPDVRLVVDIVDWCHVAARRAEVDEIELTMIGDADLARDLLAAARILAA